MNKDLARLAMQMHPAREDRKSDQVTGLHGGGSVRGGKHESVLHLVARAADVVANPGAPEHQAAEVEIEDGHGSVQICRFDVGDDQHSAAPLATPRQINQPGGKFGRGVFALGFGDDLERARYAALGFDASSRLTRQRHFWKLIRVTPNDVEPCEFGGLVAPVALPDLRRPAAEIIWCAPWSWKAYVRPERAFGGVLKHAAELAHTRDRINSKLTLHLWVFGLCELAQLCPQPARRVGNQCRSTWPVACITINVPHVAARYGFVVRVRPRKEDCDLLHSASHLKLIGRFKDLHFEPHSDVMFKACAPALLPTRKHQDRVTRHQRSDVPAHALIPWHRLVWVDIGWIDGIESKSAKAHGLGVECWEIQVGVAGHGACDVDAHLLSTPPKRHGRAASQQRTQERPPDGSHAHAVVCNGQGTHSKDHSKYKGQDERGQVCVLHSSSLLFGLLGDPPHGRDADSRPILWRGETMRGVEGGEGLSEGHGSLLCECDHVSGHGPLRLLRDLKLNLDGAQDLAGLRCHGITLARLHVSVLDGVEGVPQGGLQVGCVQFGLSAHSDLLRICALLRVPFC